MTKRLILTTALNLLLVLSLFAQEAWKPKKALLMTRFSQDVNPDKVLPEYPRPQLVRQRWLNLNGLWQYQRGNNDHNSYPKGSLAGKILVPFPVESALSGVKEHFDRLWYKRSFTIPRGWNGQKVLVHFGAVDYESEVYINGKSVGVHTGGYDPFSFDITPNLKHTGAQEIVVRVYDPTDSTGIPRGKQTLNPRGIMYTSVTGIWQTVWLEPVPKTNISSIKIIPDIDKSLVKIFVNTEGDTTGLSVLVTLKDGSRLVQSKTGKTNNEFSVPVPGAKLWSPENPFLYDLTITLMRKKIMQDSVSSYFGMRKISIEKEDGYQKLFLNNRFLFHLGPLDQGFWPDGIYTAPTDAALKYDLEMTKAMGFNMVRKHIKVEPYRWYYWADKLGLMVWQDMPSANSYTRPAPKVDSAAYESELLRMVKTHINSPSIVMWVVFNESQGQHNTVNLVNKVRGLDSSRLINQASGGEHFGAGDILDVHSYPTAAVPGSTTQALACGEYGGIAFKIKDHLWNGGFGYIESASEKGYLALYDTINRHLVTYKTNMGLSAAVYTQITDVETEVNGLLTYDRIIKADVEKIRTSNRNVIDNSQYLAEMLPSSQKQPRIWKYTIAKPDSTSWFTTNFNDSAWQSGEAGFGAPATFGSQVRTKWDSPDIWIRREFTLNNIPDKDNLFLFMQNDDLAEVYINGVKAADLGRYNAGYTRVNITKEAQNSLRPNSKNVIAIHCKQISHGQYIDAGIYYSKPGESRK